LPTVKGLAAVLNPPEGSLTEIDATTGQLLKRISGHRYDFQVPEDITDVGNDLFVADSGADAVTEVDAFSGLPVRVMSGPQYQFSTPIGLDVYGNHLHVINETGDSVTDVDLGA
jgi:hypothetical protein